MEGAGRNLLTPFTKVQLALSRFSRNAHLLDTLLVQTGIPNFMKIGQTDLCLKLSERRTDGRMWSARKWLIFYFVKID